jgi:hypothetical protein
VFGQFWFSLWFCPESTYFSRKIACNGFECKEIQNTQQKGFFRLRIKGINQATRNRKNSQ